MKIHLFKTKEPTKNGVYRKGSSSCSTCVTSRVNLVTNPVISHEWGKDREVFTFRDITLLYCSLPLVWCRHIILLQFVMGRISSKSQHYYIYMFRHIIILLTPHRLTKPPPFKTGYITSRDWRVYCLWTWLHQLEVIIYQNWVTELNQYNGKFSKMVLIFYNYFGVY
jgi:hypothetical protein